MWQLSFRKATPSLLYIYIRPSLHCEAINDIEQYFFPVSQHGRQKKNTLITSDKANIASRVDEYDRFLLDGRLLTPVGEPGGNWRVCYPLRSVSLVMLLKPSWHCEVHYPAPSAPFVFGHLKRHISLSQLGSGPLINRNDGGVLCAAGQNQGCDWAIAAWWMSDRQWCAGTQEVLVSPRTAAVRSQGGWQGWYLTQWGLFSLKDNKELIYCIDLSRFERDYCILGRFGVQSSEKVKWAGSGWHLLLACGKMSKVSLNFNKVVGFV